MKKLSYEAAYEVLETIIDEACGDSVSDFLDWRGVDEEDFEATVEYLYEAVEKLKE